MIQVPQHAYYCEELLYICKGIEYKEEILRNYLFIQLHDCLPSFFKLFLKNKRYATIHDILFIGATMNKNELREKYNLSLFMKNMLVDKEHFLYKKKDLNM